MARNYAVLGAGVLGLTAALRLLEAGERVTVYEREPLPGGLAAGFKVGSRALPSGRTEDVWLDKFYHHIFRSDHAIIRLIEEVGLGDQLDWRRPKTVTLRGGRIYQLDSPLSVLRFQPMPPVARVRMGMALAYLKLLPKPDSLEGKTAARWIRGAMGRSAYDNVWEPLLRGKFGALAEEISLPWFWARVHDRTPELGYVRGGFQHFYNRLAQRVRDQGGDVRFDTVVAKVERVDDTLRVTASDTEPGSSAEMMEYDGVVSTLPTRLTCRLAPQLPPDYRVQYEWGQAYGAHCLILALDHSLTPSSYWMNINDEGFPFMVCVEHTNYMPAADYEGTVLVYLGNYRAMHDPLFAQNKDEVLAAFLPHLARINPDFRPEWVQRSWMFAAPFAQPIVTTDYKRHIPPFETPIDGLYVANMFQVYPHDRGQNYSIELAEQLVKRITAHDGAGKRTASSVRGSMAARVR